MSDALWSLWLPCGLGCFHCCISQRHELGQVKAKLPFHTSKRCSSKTVAAYMVCSHWRKIFNCWFGRRHGASRTTVERKRLGQDELPEMSNVLILTVLQSLRKTISAAVRKLLGLHQTAVMIWRLALRSGRCDNYNEGCRIYLLPSRQKQPSQWATTAIPVLYMLTVCLWFYLLRLSKMPWNLPPSVSSWSSRWLHCMSSGLRERLPEA